MQKKFLSLTLKLLKHKHDYYNKLGVVYGNLNKNSTFRSMLKNSTVLFTFQNINVMYAHLRFTYKTLSSHSRVLWAIREIKNSLSYEAND
jgi:hypothetical protein